MPPLDLVCKYQNYRWGKVGHESLVFQLCVSGGHLDKKSSDCPFSELWIGTHPNGPSSILFSNGVLEPLEKYLKEHNDIYYGINSKDFPFLLKVLSVNTALSIQAHPNKEHAEKLNSSFPEIYKDPNHKPELVVALTVFEGLVAFRPASYIKKALKDVPELYELIGAMTCDPFISLDNASSEMVKREIKSCFTVLMNADSQKVENLLSSLSERLRSKPESLLSSEERLLLRLEHQYPGDVGCFCSFFLNYVILNPGEACFLAANVPHAYIYGDCVEVMANSDNVVRAGLTPKHRDVSVLCSMLDYSAVESQETKFEPFESSNAFGRVRHFQPPVSDFSLNHFQIVLSAENVSFRIEPVSFLSLLLVTSIRPSGSKIYLGDKLLKPGRVLLLPPNEESILHAMLEKNDEIEIEIFQAYAPQ